MPAPPETIPAPVARRGPWATLDADSPVVAAPSRVHLSQVLAALSHALDLTEGQPVGHSIRSCLIAMRIARELELAPRDRSALYYAMLLKDAGCSSRILDKPAALTPEERKAIERHPVYTWEILSHVGAFAELAPVASAHHEKLDGSGYPWGLAAAQLDFPSRILAVADVYEALTADRPYRAGMSREAALDIIARDRDTKLCGIAIDALSAYTLALAELPTDL
ncbi:MAG TPA: HD domain-containing phosphohydrolase [Gemmatimonadaceae bacterium]|nr:HD domain-containing phosphohydrolase [Gemmatimonadaceae bacterium]